MITIVVLCHNQLASTKRTITSILKHKNEVNYQVVIYDNGSTDDTDKYAKSLTKLYPEIFKYRSSETNKGFIHPNNEMMLEFKNDDILILNNDIEILSDHWIDDLYKTLYSSDEIGLTFPLNRTRGIKYCGGLIENRKERLLNYDTNDKNIEPTWAQYSCVLIKRKVIDEIGVLDELFLPCYFEDVDHSQRIKKAGYKLVLVPFIVEHYQSVTSKNLNLDKYRFENREKFYSKWGDLF